MFIYREKSTESMTVWNVLRGAMMYWKYYKEQKKMLFQMQDIHINLTLGLLYRLNNTYSENSLWNIDNSE